MAAMDAIAQKFVFSFFTVGVFFLFYHLSFCHGRLRFRFHLSSDDEAEVISVYGRVIY